VVCAIVWTCMWLAIFLESSSRTWRMAGLVGLAVVLATWWKAGELFVRVVGRLP